MKAVVVALLGSLASGCVISSAGGGGDVHPLTRRASFDFQCPKEQLHYVEIDSRSYGVSGCNRRATYVESCQQGNINCTWILNGAVESTAPVAPPAAAPPAAALPAAAPPPAAPPPAAPPPPAQVQAPGSTP